MPSWTRSARSTSDTSTCRSGRSGCGKRCTMAAPERRFTFSLADKACVVTGASRGLGRAIALAFADCGADVVLGARSHADLEAVAREVEAMGRRAVVQPTDITDLGQI